MHKQRGVIEIVLVLLLVAALGAAGYFWWDVQKFPYESGLIPGPKETLKKVTRIVPFQTLYQGSIYNIDDSIGDNIVIEDDVNFRKIWQKLSAEKELPEVDFSTEMVVVGSRGMFGTGGHSVEILKVVDNKSAIEVTVKVVKPGSRCMVTQAFEEPLHIIKLMKSEKSVLFNTQESIHNCD